MCWHMWRRRVMTLAERHTEEALHSLVINTDIFFFSQWLSTAINLWPSAFTDDPRGQRLGLCCGPTKWQNTVLWSWREVHPWDAPRRVCRKCLWSPVPTDKWYVWLFCNKLTWILVVQYLDNPILCLVYCLKPWTTASFHVWYKCIPSFMLMFMLIYIFCWLNK